MSERMTRVAMAAADWWTAVLPRATPEPAALRCCKLISHRGEHDNKEVRENTLPAFRIARRAGVWGIEADIRWTADLTPVIIHDPDGSRVFGNDAVVSELSLAELRAELPQIPSLAELIAEFGGVMHLMLEIKGSAFPSPDRQKRILAQSLSRLTPGRDYHLLALDPKVFRLFDNLPARCCLPVSELNTRTLSRVSLEHDYGGLAGHYLLLTNRLQRRHEQRGQQVGTGHVNSRNCLFRELNRGVQWIFSNAAVKLQKTIDRLLAESDRRAG